MRYLPSVPLCAALIASFLCAPPLRAEESTDERAARREEMQEKCKANPEKCEEMKEERRKKMKEKCEADPEKCEEIKKKMREKCETDPVACEKKKQEMRKRRGASEGDSGD